MNERLLQLHGPRTEGTLLNTESEWRRQSSNPHWPRTRASQWLLRRSQQKNQYKEVTRPKHQVLNVNMCKSMARQAGPSHWLQPPSEPAVHGCAPWLVRGGQLSPTRPAGWSLCNSSCFQKITHGFLGQGPDFSPGKRKIIPSFLYVGGIGIWWPNSLTRVLESNEAWVSVWCGQADSFSSPRSKKPRQSPSPTWV